MQTEIELNHLDQHLQCNYRFSEMAIETIKEEVKLFMSNREKDDSYFKFINWKKKDNELLILTMYAYDNIDLPKMFEVVFRIDQPNDFIVVRCNITQVVFNGWLPLNQISKGHKHICVVEFNEEIPLIFNLLPWFGEETVTEKNILLGFCDNKDLQMIQTHLK